MRLGFVQRTAGPSSQCSNRNCHSHCRPWRSARNRQPSLLNRPATARIQIYRNPHSPVSNRIVQFLCPTHAPSVTHGAPPDQHPHNLTATFRLIVSSRAPPSFRYTFQPAPGHNGQLLRRLRPSNANPYKRPPMHIVQNNPCPAHSIEESSAQVYPPSQHPSPYLVQHLRRVAFIWRTPNL